MTEQKETADLLFDTATKLESTVFEMQELSDLLVLLHERIEVESERLAKDLHTAPFAWEMDLILSLLHAVQHLVRDQTDEIGAESEKLYATSGVTSKAKGEQK